MDETAFDALMTEVGPQDDSILACIKMQDGAYALRFEAIDVVVERDIDRERIVLSVEIGAPHPSAALEVYETILSYNLLWRETGGVRMALTGRGGSIVQLIEISGADINARTIATVAVNMASLTEIWQGYLASPATRESRAPAPSTLSDFLRA